MAPLTLAAALFFSFDFAVVSIGLLIHSFIASNDQVDNLRAVIPRGTVLDVNREGKVILDISHLRHSSLSPDIINTGRVSIAVQALIITLVTLSACAVLFRSKTRPKFFTILGSLLAFTSLWLLSVTIAFTVIFATKSARVSASLGGVQLPQSVIDAQARALGVSPVYKDQSYRKLQLRPMTQCAHATLPPLVLHAAILPWFTWLFTTIAAVAVFSESRVHSTPAVKDGPTDEKL